MLQPAINKNYVSVTGTAQHAVNFVGTNKQVTTLSGENKSGVNYIWSHLVFPWLLPLPWTFDQVSFNVGMTGTNKNYATL